MLTFQLVIVLMVLLKFPFCLPFWWYSYLFSYYRNCPCSVHPMTVFIECYRLGEKLGVWTCIAV